MIDLTAEQWHLFTASMDCTEAAAALNRAAAEAIAAADPAIFDAAAAQWSAYGAADSEPRHVFAALLARHLHPAIAAALRLVDNLDDLIGRGMAEQTAMAYVTADFLAMSVRVEDDQARGWLIGKACEFAVNRAALLRASTTEIPDDLSGLD